jgi:hypothetical protein
MTCHYTLISEEFLKLVNKGSEDDFTNPDFFEECIQGILSLVHDAGFNAANWEMLFATLAWHYDGVTKVYPPAEFQDRIVTKYCPDKVGIRSVVKQSQESGRKFGEALDEMGVDRGKAFTILDDCRTVLDNNIENDKQRTTIAKHPSPLSVPQHLVDLYRAFYRAEKRFGATNTDVLKPILRAKEVVLKAPRNTNSLELTQMILGDLCNLMQQIHNGTAKGRYVIHQREWEQQAILAFADFFVNHLLMETFGGDRSKMSSKTGIGLIEDACSALFRLEDHKESI